ncbi:hypothetical protein MNBD_GAMMA07-2596 [hydrothermal vent metagenome]|uniref:Thioredoxin domain-containing protein n=1 Tax=hydrothermal vent metagenome TaxID=652676 RepID=A0A3B0XN08_9ZZZZ
MKLFSLILLFSILSLNQTFADKKLPHGIIKLDGRLAPSLMLKDMDGETFDLSKSRGKWAFVHFWATWCGPCRKEMPTIQKIISQYKGTNLDIVVVNTAETEDIVFSFLGLLAPDVNSLLDEDGLVTEQWQPRGLPATYFVDPQGKLQYLALGGRTWDKPAYIQFLNQFK